MNDIEHELQQANAVIDMIKTYQDVLKDYRRLTRELDIALNGEGAAAQASLCDLVAQMKSAGTLAQIKKKERSWSAKAARDYVGDVFTDFDGSDYSGDRLQELIESGPCHHCDGNGWTAEHDPRSGTHGEDGCCLGYCPVQAPCERCNGTGYASV